MKLSLLFALCFLLATATPTYADCNRFESIQQVLLSEGANQPLPTLIELARVVHTKGDCFRDDNYYSGYAIARFIAENEPSHCIASVHCRAYYLLYSIPPSEREPVAIAAYIALTERPAVSRFHFDNADAPLAAWWDNPIACPTGWFLSGDFRIC